MSTETTNKTVTLANSKKHRQSLQHTRIEVPHTNFRHTQSHRYDSEGKKKLKKATILTPVSLTISEGSENESDDRSPEKKSEEKPEKKTDQLMLENEKRVSKTSKKSEKSIYAFDNTAYEGNVDKRSVSSRAESSRAPSVQSLEVVREQYCCCAKRTRCEKQLLVTVTVLSIVVVVLVVVLSIVASHRGEDLRKVLSKWAS